MVLACELANVWGASDFLGVPSQCVWLKAKSDVLPENAHYYSSCRFYRWDLLSLSAERAGGLPFKRSHLKRNRFDYQPLYGKGPHAGRPNSRDLRNLRKKKENKSVVFIIISAPLKILIWRRLAESNVNWNLLAIVLQFEHDVDIFLHGSGCI